MFCAITAPPFLWSSMSRRSVVLLAQTTLPVTRYLPAIGAVSRVWFVVVECIPAVSKSSVSNARAVLKPLLIVVSVLLVTRTLGIVPKFDGATTPAASPGAGYVPVRTPPASPVAGPGGPAPPGSPLAPGSPFAPAATGDAGGVLTG